MPYKDPTKRKTFHRDYMAKRQREDPKFKERTLELTRNGARTHRATRKTLIDASL